MKKILTTVSIVLVLAGAYFIYQSYARKANAERAASEWAEIKEDTSAARFDNFISRFQQSEFAGSQNLSGGEYSSVYYISGL